VLEHCNKCGTPTTHIIKQPIGVIKEYNIDLSDSVENEWLCLKIEERKLVLAMAVHGKNRHYRWSEIQLRHWLETAEKCHFPLEDMQKIIDGVFANIIDVIGQVRSNLPENFPSHISEPIFSGLERMKNLENYKS